VSASGPWGIGGLAGGLAVCAGDGGGDQVYVAVVEAAEVGAQVDGDVVVAEAGGDAEHCLLGAGAGEPAGVEGVDGGFPSDDCGGLAGEGRARSGDDAAEGGLVQEMVVAGDQLDRGEVGGNAGGGAGEQADELAGWDGGCVHEFLRLVAGELGDGFLGADVVDDVLAGRGGGDERGGSGVVQGPGQAVGDPVEAGDGVVGEQRFVAAGFSELGDLSV